jgi:hypothetical protein
MERTAAKHTRRQGMEGDIEIDLSWTRCECVNWLKSPSVEAMDELLWNL